MRAMPVTHTHFDHILDAGVVGARTGAVLAGSASTAAVGRSLGLPAEQLAVAEPGEPLQFGRFTVTFLPAGTPDEARRPATSPGPSGSRPGSPTSGRAARSQCWSSTPPGRCSATTA